MPMSHADCNHSRTPAGRAACRAGRSFEPREAVVQSGPLAGATVRLVDVAPRRQPVSKNVKPFSIKNEGDLAAEVPHVFSTAIRHAWEKGWEVRSGHPYNDTEKRIVITSDQGALALVYKAGTPGVNGVFWRPWNTSVTRRLTVGPVIANGITKLDRGDRVEDPE